MRSPNLQRFGLLALASTLAACGGSAPEPPRPAAAEVSPAASPPPPPEAAPAADTLRSVVTPLAEGSCTTVQVDEEAGGSTQECPGVGGYRVLVLDGDARMSITLRAPGGAEQPLDLWSTVTNAFSSLADSAEWRVRGVGEGAAPVGLIVEVRASESPEDPERVTVYRAVAKVGPGGSCVTHRLDAAATRDQVLRAADSAADTPCLPPLGG